MKSLNELSVLTLIEGVVVALIGFILVDLGELLLASFLLIPLLLMLFELFIIDDVQKSMNKKHFE